MAIIFIPSEIQQSAIDNSDPQSRQCLFYCKTLLLNTAFVLWKISVSSVLNWRSSDSGDGNRKARGSRAGSRMDERAAPETDKQLTETHLGESQVSCCPPPPSRPPSSAILQRKGIDALCVLVCACLSSGGMDNSYFNLNHDA